jgi:hypothetical protein
MHNNPVSELAEPDKYLEKNSLWIFNPLQYQVRTLCGGW